MNRLMINVCSEDLEKSKHFYLSLFDFDISFDSDWFVHLLSKNKQLELAIILKGHEIVPKEIQSSPQGFYITIVVEDVEKVFKSALKDNVDIIKKPHDTFYGQRRLLLKDPNGAIIDVSAPIANFQIES